MGLKSVFQNAAKTALGVAGDVRKDVRYLSYVSTVHDVSTGAVSVIGHSYFFSMLFETYSQREIDDIHIKPSDIKAFFAQVEVPRLLPDIRDEVHVCEIYGSTAYEIKNIETDPADALWIFQLRARGKGVQ